MSLFVESFLGKNGKLEQVRSRLLKSLIALANGKSEITVGTICTGWGVADMVVDSLNDLIAEHGNESGLPVPKVGSKVAQLAYLPSTYLPTYIHTCIMIHT